MRARYVRRKAKQARRASPEKTVPARSQIPISPKRNVVAPPSAFSPSKRGHSLRPELSQKVPESPEKRVSFEVRNPISPEIPVANLPSDLSHSVERDHSFNPAARGPSHNIQSPAITATAPSMLQRATNIPDMPLQSLPSNNKPRAQRTPEKTPSPHHDTLKRRHVAIEDDFPSSSPLGPTSPKRRRPIASELPLEIASTPDKKRKPGLEGLSSPVIDLELEEYEPSLLDDSTENDDPLGQELSDTVFEGGHVVNETQSIFEDATQPIEFDIPEPEGGWDEEERLLPTFSSPVSLDIPPPDDGHEDNKYGIKDSTQLVDFEFLPREGGWNGQEVQEVQEVRVKEEPESPNAGIYDPPLTLRDTQAILRSKTLAPDFSILDPDGGWNSLIASSPPMIPSSPRAESVFSQTDLKDQMDAWIDAHAIKGISVEQVESVLKSTSMDTNLAHKAIRHLRRKGVLPKDRRGLWTESDDEDLKSTDARKIQRLQEKHGADCLAARWEFLDFYADEP